jgi:hypothetical protein
VTDGVEAGSLVVDPATVSLCPGETESWVPGPETSAPTAAPVGTGDGTDSSGPGAVSTPHGGSIRRTWSKSMTSQGPLALFVEPIRLLSRLHLFAGILAAVVLLSGSRTTALGLIAWTRGPYTWDLDLSDLGVLLVYFIAGLLIQRAIARQREYLADAEAFLLTRAPGQPSPHR